MDIPSIASLVPDGAPSVEGTKSAPRTGASPQLLKAANSFEANFLGELLKPMREDPLFGQGSGLGGDSLGSEGAGSGSMGTIGSLASEALAQAIVKQGGLGIAKMVLAQLVPVERGPAQTTSGLSGSEGIGYAERLGKTPDGGTSFAADRAAMLGEGNLSHSSAIEPPGNGRQKQSRAIHSTFRDNQGVSSKATPPIGSERNQ